jgi:transposase
MRVNKEVIEMRRKVRNYTNEFKQEAINLALKSACVSTTAEELGIPAATLHTWIHTLKKQGNITSLDKNNAKDMATLIEENRRLHKELAIAKEEREILKKAAAYFAQHQK